MLWLLVVIVLSIDGQGIAPHSANAQDILTGLAPPGGSHVLGTDQLGRDILSRVMAGARSIVIGALAIAVGSSLLSAALGVLAGYVGGVTETIIMRLMDLMLALPALLVIIVVAGAFSGTELLSVILLTVLSTPGATRLIRGVALEQRARPYVEAARVMGMSRRRIMLKHIGPNVLSQGVVNLTLGFTFGLISLASLSFLGLGVAPGSPDWGIMVSENNDLLSINPWAVMAPALAIVLTAAAANVVGDWAYERIQARGRAR